MYVGVDMDVYTHFFNLAFLLFFNLELWLWRLLVLIVMLLMQHANMFDASIIK